MPRVGLYHYGALLSEGGVRFHAHARSLELVYCSFLLALRKRLSLAEFPEV